MFDAMPPGQLATRMRPTARPASKFSSQPTSQPHSGMIVYCAPKPSATQPGILPMRRKSSRLKVSPMPSIDAASDQRIHGLSNHSIVCGQKNAMTARLTSHTG
jgi:hypothetical protein